MRGLARPAARRAFAGILAKDAVIHVAFAVAQGARSLSVRRIGGLLAERRKRRPVACQHARPSTRRDVLQIPAEALTFFGGPLTFSLFQLQTNQLGRLRFRWVLESDGFGLNDGFGSGVGRRLRFGGRRRAAAAGDQSVGQPTGYQARNDALARGHSHSQ
jgi:hypothetical protein